MVGITVSCTVGNRLVRGLNLPLEEMRDKRVIPDRGMISEGGGVSRCQGVEKDIENIRKASSAKSRSSVVICLFPLKLIVRRGSRWFGQLF